MDKLKTLSTKEIKVLWLKYFKTPVPKLKNPVLLKYIYWHQQAKQHRVALTSFYNLIEKTAKDIDSDKPVKDNTIFEIGTKFIRSYKGDKHEVEVIKDGFLYKGEIYKSLSAIARKITGVHWNGKKFFRGENGR